MGCRTRRPAQVWGIALRKGPGRLFGLWRPQYLWETVEKMKYKLPSSIRVIAMFKTLVLWSVSHP
ncbi:hypothetical protein ACRRTK_017446 [Alexandromys fortis]